MNQSENSADLQAILTLGSYAPSSHNTQPWKVKIEGHNLLVGYDPGRQLLVGDPEKRELFISLGCFIQTLIYAAEDLGYSMEYSFLGEQPQKVAKLSLKQATSKPKSMWGKYIINRRSDRRFYDNIPLDKTLVKTFLNLNTDLAEMHLFTNTKDINFLAQATYNATYKLMLPQDFRNELSDWVRNNWTRKPDGMPGYTQGMPAPLSLLAKFVIKKNRGVAKDQAKKDSQRVKHSAAVGIICTSKQSPNAWIEAGRLYQKLCITALRNDVKTSAISASVIDPQTATTTKETLQLNEQPVALIRFGQKPGIKKATPRLRAADFLVS